MLDAFGKGASDDIRAAKNELYGQMTWDPVTHLSLNVPPQISTPRPSPPPSPKLDTALSGGLDSNSAGVELSTDMIEALKAKTHLVRHNLSCEDASTQPALCNNYIASPILTLTMSAPR